MKSINPVRYTSTWEVFIPKAKPQTHIFVKGQIVKLGRGK